MEDRKNVLLIGFNGNIGAEIGKAGIKSNNVHCLMRSAPKIGINSIFLKFLDGDAQNSNDLEEALDGKDIVVSAYGVPSDNENPNAIEQYTEKLVSAMKKKGVKRLIVIGSSGCVKQKDSTPYLQSNAYPENLLTRAKDHQKAAKIIEESGLDYTIVCPHQLTANQNQNQAKTVQKVDKQMGDVNPTAIANWIEQELKQNKWVKKVVGVSN